MLIAVIVLATLLTALGIAGAVYYRHAEETTNELRGINRNLRHQNAKIDKDLTSANADYDKLYAQATAELDKQDERYNDLDAIARGYADKLAALSAHEALVIDRETLPAWDDVTGIHRMPVGPDSPDFTGEWNATDVQALRDRFDRGDQLALVGSGLSREDKRAEREMDDAA